MQCILFLTSKFINVFVWHKYVWRKNYKKKKNFQEWKQRRLNSGNSPIVVVATTRRFVSSWAAYTKINCESVHFFGWPTVSRSHLPRHEGAASALQRVVRPVSPSPRHRNFALGSSSWMEELSTISSVVLSWCSASRSQRITTRSPVEKTEHCCRQILEQKI